jgi:MoxR-like ATPase
MSSEERLRQAALLNRAGLSYVGLLRSGGARGLAPRPTLARRLAGLLHERENVLLVGRPGSGRRSLVRLALQAVLADEQAALEGDLATAFLALLDDQQPSLPEGPESSLPPLVLDIVEIPVSSFQVEAIYVGELETKVASLLENARKAGAAVFVPDLHLAIAAGSSAQNPERTGAALLVPPLRRGELHLIGSTTPQGLQVLRHLHPELLSALVPIDVPDADDSEAEQLLAAVGEALPHDVRLAPGAAADAVRLSRRSHAGEALPGRAFDLVRETGARLRGDGAPTGAVVDGGDLLETYRLRAGLRPELVHARHPLRRSDVEQHLASRVVAQPAAVAAAARLVVAFKAGLVSADRPVGTFLFAGPTGVGKTHLAQCLAEYLFGSRARMIRFDMGEYADGDAVERFVGSHAHARESGLLAKVRGTPFAVLLLDEIEKAHPRVLGALLSLLDEGTLTDARGDAVSAQNIVIILTTNVGADVYRKSPIALQPGAGDGRESSVRRELEREFSPEFLNRMTEVVVFRSLDEEALRRVARRELDAVARLAAGRGLDVRVEPTVAALVARVAAESVYGAREVHRAVRRLVVDEVAEAVAGLGLGRVHVSVVDGSVIVSDILPRLSLAAPLRAGLRSAPTPAERGRIRHAVDRLRSLRPQLVRDPRREDCVHEAARALVLLGQAAQHEGRPHLARKFLREALGLWMRLLPEGDCAAELALDVASSHLGLCVLARDAGEETHHLVSAVRFLGRAPGRSARAQRMWAVARQALGQLGTGAAQN